MDEARTVLARLERIETLDGQGAPPGLLLAELRALVGEAEQWARRERDPRAASAAAGCARALEQRIHVGGGVGR